MRLSRFGLVSWAVPLGRCLFNQHSLLRLVRSEIIDIDILHKSVSQTLLVIIMSTSDSQMDFSTNHGKSLFYH